jgi:hypothetical protein
MTHLLHRDRPAQARRPALEAHRQHVLAAHGQHVDEVEGEPLAAVGVAAAVVAQAALVREGRAWRRAGQYSCRHANSNRGGEGVWPRALSAAPGRAVELEPQPVLGHKVADVEPQVHAADAVHPRRREVLGRRRAGARVAPS